MTVPSWRSELSEVDVVDFKGDYWWLMFAGLKKKKDGVWYAMWRVIEGPAFLQENGARYDIIPTPLTEI